MSRQLVSLYAYTWWWWIGNEMKHSSVNTDERWECLLIVASCFRNHKVLFHFYTMDTFSFEKQFNHQGSSAFSTILLNPLRWQWHACVTMMRWVVCIDFLFPYKRVSWEFAFADKEIFPSNRNLHKWNSFVFFLVNKYISDLSCFNNN